MRPGKRRVLQIHPRGMDNLVETANGYIRAKAKYPFLVIIYQF